MYKRILTLSLSAVMLFTVVYTISSRAQSESDETALIQLPKPYQNQELFQALSQLTALKQELKQLRNSLEHLEFETENAKIRQQALLQDLGRRLVEIEKNQQQAAQQLGQITQDNPDNAAIIPGTGEIALADQQNPAGQVTVVPDGTIDESQASTNLGQSEETVLLPTQQQDGSTSLPSADNAEIVNAVSLEEQNAYEQAFELLKQSRYEDSVLGFQQLVDTWPNSQLADDAYYWMSESRYVNRELELALRGFRTIVIRYPDSRRVPEALLKIGYIHYDVGAYEDAAETFREILARFPGHPVTVSAQTRLRRIEQTIQ